MEQTSPPKLCVPIQIPNTSVQTYAVLELVGLTTSAPANAFSLQISPLQQSVINKAPFPSPISSQTEISSSASDPESNPSDMSQISSSNGKKSTKGGSTSPPSYSEQGLDHIKQQQQVVPATTFIQADVLNFREVVQKHTGAGDDVQEKLPVTLPARQQAANNRLENGAKKGENASRNGRPAYKLHERKQNLRNLEIKQLNSPFKRPGCSPRGLSPRTSDNLSPTIYDHLPALLPSPVTPLSTLSLDPFDSGNRPGTPTDHLNHCFATTLRCDDDVSTHSHVIQNFPFLHPQLQHRKAEPELLDLFPVHSPRLKEADSM